MRKLILVIPLLIFLLTVAHSEWETATPPTYIEEVVYDTTQVVRRSFWLDQADQDSVQVIFEEEHYTHYEVSGPGMLTDESPHLDSVFYDTVRYYRK